MSLCKIARIGLNEKKGKNSILILYFLKGVLQEDK
jgi:hypothetical protein